MPKTLTALDSPDVKSVVHCLVPLLVKAVCSPALLVVLFRLLLTHNALVLSFNPLLRIGGNLT